jgi:hypothetical protein
MNYFGKTMSIKIEDISMHLGCIIVETAKIENPSRPNFDRDNNLCALLFVVNYF